MCSSGSNGVGHAGQCFSQDINIRPTYYSNNNNGRNQQSIYDRLSSSLFDGHFHVVNGGACDRMLLNLVNRILGPFLLEFEAQPAFLNS